MTSRSTQSSTSSLLTSPDLVEARVPPGLSTIRAFHITMDALVDLPTSPSSGAVVRRIT